jgi:uncharacterized protein (DUF433 family)
LIKLGEAHLLAAIRRKHHVPLPTVRRALRYVADHLQLKRPLAEATFETDGIDLFVERLGQLINVSKEGQTEMSDMIRAYLKRIERDERGLPVKLYLFTRKDELQEREPSVVVDPRVAFGRPVLARTAVPTAILADRFKAGDTLSELAGDYGTSPQAIEEAIRCELAREAA